MTSKQLKQLYINFFQSKGHRLIPSASLIPENDPSVLFTTAGMHPLVPYLLGERHPQGDRLVNVQKCLRTDDIDDVGDPTHLTFFEMLGNWSLGEYFKKESIEWSYEFLTSEKYLALNPKRIFITVFAGENNIPRDEESARLWESVGVARNHVYYMSAKDNFWGPVGETGPCGPDTEIFVDTEKEKCSNDCKPGCSCGKYFEIWNNVFMEYEKKSDGSFAQLKQKNVDTGMGVERTAAVLSGGVSVYDCDVFDTLLSSIRSGSSNVSDNEKSLRIVADHIRAVVFLLSDDKHVRPSNVDQGYILRRLIRRIIRHAKILGFDYDGISDLAQIVIHEHHYDYPELIRNRDTAMDELQKEKDRFLKTLEQGIRVFEKHAQKGSVSGEEAFTLYTSYGFPLEMVEELASEKKIIINRKEFEKYFHEHQEKSRTASVGKFKGGLADHSEQTIQYHTANHLLLEALKRVLGRDAVHQKGSNITAQRLRFDFTWPDKLTSDQIGNVENLVNAEILKAHDVRCEAMTVDEAKKLGATGVFDHKYGDKVKVYFIGDFSKEICGGPHVTSIKGMGKLSIIKEEASSAGVRRIKAVLK